MAGVLERFHFLGKELKENVLKIKGKDFWKEKRTEGKKKCRSWAFFHLGDLFFEWLSFSPFWGLCASWVFDLCFLVSLNRSCSLGLTQEGHFWFLRGLPALSSGGEARGLPALRWGGEAPQLALLGAGPSQAGWAPARGVTPLWPPSGGQHGLDLFPRYDIFFATGSLLTSEFCRLLVYVLN